MTEIAFSPEAFPLLFGLHLETQKDQCEKAAQEFCRKFGIKTFSEIPFFRKTIGELFLEKKVPFEKTEKTIFK